MRKNFKKSYPQEKTIEERLDCHWSNRYYWIDKEVTSDDRKKGGYEMRWYKFEWGTVSAACNEIYNSSIGEHKPRFAESN